MELKVLEEKTGSISVEIAGETHTFLNLLTQATWKEGAKQAAYFMDHPYLSNPKITVSSSDPKKTLKDSVQSIIDDCQDFSRAFKRSLKK